MVPKGKLAEKIWEENFLRIEYREDNETIN